MRRISVVILLGSFFALALQGCGGAPPLPSPGIFMYAAGLHDGNLGGRAGADAFVQSNLPSGLAGKTVIRAFISVNSTDCIANMPSNYVFPSNVPIYNQDGTVKIGDNWADLLDGSPDSALSAALNMNETEPEVYNWWSGSTSTGNVSYTCNGWTSNADSGTNTGTVGTKNNAAAAWICLDGVPVIPRGNATYYVLGITY